MEREWALNARRALVEAVAILAAPAEAQVARLSSIGTRPSADELALEFDDWYQLIPQLEALGIVSQRTADLADGVARALTGIREGQWEESALAANPAWNHVRQSAGLTLVELLKSSPEPHPAYVRAAS